MKKTIRKAASLFLVFIAISSAAILPVSAAETGILHENEAIILKFDSVPNIARIITSTYGMSAGHLDNSLECRFFCAPGLFTVSLSETDRFSADEYKYMKIKFFANTLTKTSVMYFGTETEPDFSGARAVSFDRGKNKVWRDRILQLDKLSSAWTGTISSLRFDINTGYAEAVDEYVFIEYIAFFKTEAEAKAFGGLTEAQQNGDDLITRYSEGYRTSKVDSITYTVPGKTDNTSETSNISSGEELSDTVSTVSDGGKMDTATAIIMITATIIAAAAILLVLFLRKNKS